MFKDKFGRNATIPSTIAYVKNLPNLASKVIKDRGIVDPRLVFGIDGGNNKIILTITRHPP